MGKINRHNYEIFFIDYLDGNLTDGQIGELNSFLKSNPDLKEELNALSQYELQPDQKIQFNYKDSLKKNPEISLGKASNLDELCIAEIEGDIRGTERTKFYEMLRENPKLSKTLELFKKTKLRPDYSIVYPEKSKLKQQKVIALIPQYIQRTLAYAAGIILIVAVYLNISTNDSNKEYKTLSDNAIIKVSKENPGSPFVKPDNYNFSIKTEKSLNIDYNNLVFEPELKIKQNDFRPNLNKLNPLTAEIKTGSSAPLYALELIDMQGSDIEKTGIETGPADNKKIDTPFLASAEKANNARNGFSLLDIADLGFKGINKLTGKDWVIKRYYNKEGELTKLALKAESVSFSTNIKN